MLVKENIILKCLMLRAKLGAVITLIDRLMSDQLSKIIKHKDFLALEASWRNIAYLMKQAKQVNKVRLYILPLSKIELCKDLTQAFEFDHTELFKKIYNHGFDIAGGEPFNIIIGDYEFTNNCFDIEVLKCMSQIAAAAFAPFIAGAAPSLLGLSCFDELGRMPDLTKIFAGSEYQYWRKLRAQEDIRFIALILPHHLLRLPYEVQLRSSLFQYKEARPETGYLWGNAAFAFAALLIGNFKNNAWFTNISDGKGPFAGIDITATDVQRKNFNKLTPDLPLDAMITDQQERYLREQGLMALCIKAGTQSPIFYSCPSLQQIIIHKNEDNSNYRTSSLLNYLLCACRFVHYIKIIARDKIGSFVSVHECAEFLNFWLMQYAAANTDLGFVLRVKFPLQEGRIEVRSQPMRPDFYFCTIYLKPFFQLEQLKSEFIFITELNLKTNKISNL